MYGGSACVCMRHCVYVCVEWCGGCVVVCVCVCVCECGYESCRCLLQVLRPSNGQKTPKVYAVHSTC